MGNFVEIYCNMNDINIYEELETENANFNDYITDDVRNYLTEIGKVPLLTPEQEYELAIRIKDGDKN